MRTVVVLFLSSCSSLVHAQACDTPDGRVVNRVDAGGVKQGYWMEREKVIAYSAHSGYGSKEGCRYSEQAYHITRAEGQYEDGERVGPWIHYHRTVARGQGSKAYEMVYDPCGEESGALFYLPKDTVQMRFSGAEGIIIGASGQAVKTFPRPDFDYEMERLRAGEYFRELRKTR